MNTRTYSPSGRRTKGWLKAALFGASFALLGAAHAQTVTIPAANTNTASNRQPLGNFWGYERTHFLIRAAEIGVTGNITSIGFYVNSLSSPAATTPVVIKMKTSTNTTVTSSAYATASTGATTVYTGNITSGMLSANSWVTITLSTPFAYAGNSLEVFVEANGGGSGIEGGSAKLFRWAAPSPAATCCQYWNADNSPPTSNGTTNAYRPNVQLAISAAAPCSGTPNAGSVTSPVSICGGSAATLSATGVSTGGTITYQWQESPDGASGWANVVGGSGATTTTYTTTAVNATRYFRMVTTCGNSGQSNNTNTVTVNALTATYATYTPAGLSEGFEAWGNQCSTNDVPGGNWKNTPSTGNNSWRRNDQPNDGGWQYPTGGTYTPASSQGTYSARFHSYGSTSGLQGSLDYYVNMGAGTGADQISFDFINPTGGDVLAVLVSTDGGATFTQIGSNLATSSAWTNKTLSLSSTSATTVIRLRATSDYGDDDIGVDNFKITSPCSGTPLAGTVTSPVGICSGFAAVLTATGTSSGPGISYQWQESPDGTSGWANVSGGSGATTTTYTTTAVNATRYFRMVTTCSGSGQSNNTNVVTVNVLAPVYATYTVAGVSEGFENWINLCSSKDVPGTNWKSTPATGNNSWRRDDQGMSDGGWTSNGGAYSPLFSQGAHSARFHSYNATSGLQGALDYYVNMSGGTGADQISFDFINPTGTDVLAVLVSTDGGTTFTQIGSNLTTSSAWTNKTFSLSSTSATTVIRLRATSDYGDNDIGVDNFKIQSPCMGTPTAGTISGNTPAICVGNG
ncbi:MAG: hypothetical protein JST38_15930, partial [Bacteroidetes bacterium]|nr:hypothetical protein [Bacteroidota bacterium]